MKKDTVGSISTELLSNAFTDSHTPADQLEAQLKDYEHNIHMAILAGQKIYEGDFYIVVLTKVERLMKNVIRFYFFPRQSCPTPQHEQVVYRYHHETGDVEHLWVVPSLEASVTLVNEALMAHPDERQLLQFVLDFRDGTLLRQSMALNGESIAA